MERERIRRRHLPHWDVPGAAYFVTVCLDGSIPAQGLLDLADFGKQLEQRPMPASMSEEAWLIHKRKLLFVRQEKWLDHEPGNRVLEKPALAKNVVDALFHFSGQRYDLLAYVVMPSHFHWLFQPRDGWVQTIDTTMRSARERIMYSVKRYTANQCNRHLGVRGTFWQQESYDHWVRDCDELERIIRYIEQNPVKANLVRNPEDWRFGSASFRKLVGIEFGTPLTIRRQDRNPNLQMS
jgi:type I restriction enzyme R subunit